MKVIQILHIERRYKDQKLYYRTYALLESGEVAVGYGANFKVDDRVQVFYHEKYGTIKMQLSTPPIDSK